MLNDLNEERNGFECGQLFGRTLHLDGDHRPRSVVSINVHAPNICVEILDC